MALLFDMAHSVTKVMQAAWSRFLDVVLWVMAAPYRAVFAVVAAILRPLEKRLSFKAQLTLWAAVGVLLIIWEFSRSESLLVNALLMSSALLLSAGLLFKRFRW